MAAHDSDLGDYWIWLFPGADIRGAFHARREQGGMILVSAATNRDHFSAEHVELLGKWLLEQAKIMRNGDD